MRVLFGGYRTWALDAFEIIKHVRRNDMTSLVQKHDELIEQLESPRVDYDIVFLAGWSWMIPTALCKRYYIVSVHPSDLPEYAGGSPLQHQILDGVKDSKMTLFQVTEMLDAGPILHKVPLNLEGNMEQIFTRMTVATCQLYLAFIVNPYASILQISTKTTCRKRLKPADSRLDKSSFDKRTCAQIYDSIRCREDPYPNAFIEDDTGTLTFNRVTFVSKKGEA